MERLTDLSKVGYLLDRINCEKEYPFSIFERRQSGEIYTDDPNAPSCALFWHYCGFAHFAGKCDERILSDILYMMKVPTEGHSGRLVLQADKDSQIGAMLRNSSETLEKERYVFIYENPLPDIHPSEGCSITPVTEDNYHLIKGRITPPFSWSSKEEFLANGFGVCIEKDGRILSCAFSAAVSDRLVDIGVETAEDCRGRGLGRAAAYAMAQEILRRGKTPTWGCDTMNKASMKLALSVGFRIVGTHPWYKLKA